jgi:serine/threonine kinase 32
MKALIQKNVPDRIGANGFENYTKHPFFHPIDFEALEKLEVEPVFIPSREDEF